MDAKVWISEILFNDGSNVNLSENDIVLIVGPNNSGKSATLREMAKLVYSKNEITKVVKGIKIGKVGDENDLINSLSSISKISHNGVNPEPFVHGLNYNIHLNAARAHWNRSADGLHELTNVFVNTLNTENRLTLANPARNIKLTVEQIQHPIHFIQKYDKMEIEFSSYFKQAFGKDLILYRGGGAEVPIYIGDRPNVDKKIDEDRVSSSYLEKVEKLDLLHEQGDGMRSFVGVLLNTFISHYSVLFIDEPEAFLHPPQARILGKMISKFRPTERQLFFTTHSEDFLKGLLESSSKNLKIIRIQRNGDINNVSVLDNDAISRIWQDSLLRHSNILAGLFHSRVVICESDSDARFYSAILTILNENSENYSQDILFINCGGKHRLTVAIKALIKLNVDIRVVADIDILNDERVISGIVNDLGGDWSKMQKFYKVFKSNLEQKRPELLTVEIKQRVNEIFDGIKDQYLSSSKINEIQCQLKKASVWSELKQAGKSFIPAGEATSSFAELQKSLVEFGIHIVEVGELENFDKSIGNHGPKWVEDVLEKDLLNDPNLEEAREFVKSFCY